MLDAIAYRLLGRVAAYTPEMHYDLRRQMYAKCGYTMRDNERTYWWSMVRSRLADLYWALRP